MEVEREYRKQQSAAGDLEGRVRDHIQVSLQERMQVLQEAERREMAAERVQAAAIEIEARLADSRAGGQAPVAHSTATRRRRWGDDSDTEEEGGRERSQRRPRGGRQNGTAMED